MISYGPSTALKYILIDGGRSWTYKHALKRYLSEHCINELELLVITHVDRDHIDGMLSMMQDNTLPLRAKNVWFNTWDHLEGKAIEVASSHDDLESFGAKMGEEISPLLMSKGWPWNRQFGGAAVKVGTQPEDNVILLGALRLTLLSPNQEKLDDLKPAWQKECQEAGITPGATLKEYVSDEDEDIESFGAVNIDALAAEPFIEDHSPANGSSIALLLEYGGRKLLLAGDAHADILQTGLQALGASAATPIAVDAFKIPHHGSKFNLSKDLLELLDCRHYLISTNGNYFKHPDEVAMARLIKFGTVDSTVHFNYKTKHNLLWKNDAWQLSYRYQVEFPSEESDGYKTLKF